MRTINYIVIHCTATQPTATVDSIRNYWKNTLKWNSPGYHYLIEVGGRVVPLLPETLPSNGVKGFNAMSVHVSYIGGVDAAGKPKDTRSTAQKHSLLMLIKDLRAKYPSAIIQGHRDFPGVKKACPSFDAKTEYKDI